MTFIFAVCNKMHPRLTKSVPVCNTCPQSCNEFHAHSLSLHTARNTDVNYQILSAAADPTPSCHHLVTPV